MNNSYGFGSGFGPDFGSGFDDFRRVAEGFGECIKKMAEERGYANTESDWTFPLVNSWKTDDGKLVHQFVLPGFEESGISVTFKGDSMVLKARMPESAAETESIRYQRREFTLRNIDRQEFPVPADIWDQEKTTAVLRDGILTVTVPAKAEAEGSGGVRIEIIKEGN